MASTKSTYPMRASLEGLESEIFKLVSSSATPEQWAEWLRAPLEHAAAEGNLDLVHKLVEAGATVIAGWKGCGGRTLLHAAAVGGNEGVLSALLRAGAQPDVNTLESPPSSLSPLYLATKCGHEAVARLLIKAGADVNFHEPKYAHTVLHEALWYKHDGLATELMMNGANVEALNSGNRTPLHFAAEKGLNGIVSALLLRGVDVDAVDGGGHSALIKASSGIGNGPHLAVVETLLAAGADSNKITRDRQETALHMAAYKGHVPIIKAIIQSGAEVNSRDATGMTALHRAADDARSINALIEAGADIEVKCDRGWTPLAFAAVCGKANAMLALLQHGAIVDSRDNKQMTPLHTACFEKPEDLVAVVDLLLQWDADETALDECYGETPEALLDNEDGDWFCTHDDLDHARLLLARAPAARAWRRRCWLVMLRSRASKARNANCDIGSEGGGDSKAPCGQAREGRTVVAKSDGAAFVAHGGGGQASDSSGGCLSGEIEILSGVVASLVGLGPEGVFRRIVSYL